MWDPLERILGIVVSHNFVDVCGIHCILEAEHETRPENHAINNDAY